MYILKVYDNMSLHLEKRFQDTCYDVSQLIALMSWENTIVKNK